MAFKAINDLDADTTVSLGGFDKKTRKDNPTKAEGYYLGSREVKTTFGPSQLHFLQTPKGNLGIWGKTNMDKKLASVTPGTMVRITFTGMSKASPGKNPAYLFKVEADEDNTIEVAAVVPEADESSPGNDDDDEVSYLEATDGLSDDDSEDEDAAQAAALAAAERKAKVQAMLNKNKKTA